MSGGRIYAPRPKTPTGPSFSPLARPRSPFAPGPAWDVRVDRDEPHSTAASPPAVQGHTFSFADISLYSREERAALDKVGASRSAGTKVDAETERFLALRGFSAGPRAPQSASVPRAAHNLPLQAKLKVGPADDPLEREADAVAEHVMRPESARARTPTSFAAGETLQRACAQCGEEDELRRKAEGAPASSLAAPPIVNHVLGSPGQPLDGATRAFMEPRFGYDFRHVRIHTNDAASRSAEALGARAYTCGQNIAFRRGEYAPESLESRTLLAHELAHVVQQGSGQTLGLRRKTVCEENSACHDDEDDASMNSSQADASLQSSQPAASMQSTSLPDAPTQSRDASSSLAAVVGGAASSLKPPGNCTQKQWYDLQQIVRQECKVNAPRACVQGDSPDIINQKMAQFQRCIDARVNLNNTCFGGGDPRHQLEIFNLTNGLNRCKELPEPVAVPAPQPQEEPKPNTERSSLWEFLAGLGLAVGTILVVIAALADPEPASKLALAGLSAAMIALILKRVGREPEGA